MFFNWMSIGLSGIFFYCIVYSSSCRAVQMSNFSKYLRRKQAYASAFFFRTFRLQLQASLVDLQLEVIGKLSDILEGFVKHLWNCLCSGTVSTLVLWTQEIDAKSKATWRYVSLSHCIQIDRQIDPIDAITTRPICSRILVFRKLTCNSSSKKSNFI